MIINFWIISQIFGLAIVTLVSLYALTVALTILRKWDFSKRTEEQFLLEKKTYLVSTLMHYALGFQILSLLIFVATAEYLHSFIQGAMCAFGSLNANPYGFKALGIKIVAVFFYSLWLIINHIDSRAEDYPLVRLKYSLLVALIPLLSLDFYLEVKYFVSISPDVITTCCGSAFRSTSNPYGFIAQNLPFVPLLAAFFLLYPLTLILLFITHRRPMRKLSLASSALSILTFSFSLLAMLTFLSPYYNVILFGLPTQHKCPFKILKIPFLGYTLYTLLFVGGIAGSSLALLEYLKRYPSLPEIKSLQKSLSLYALVGFSTFFLSSLIFMLLYYREVGTLFYH